MHAKEQRVANAVWRSITKQNSYTHYNGKTDYQGLSQYAPLWEVYNGATLCKRCHDTIPKKLKSDEFYMTKELAKIFVDGLKANNSYILARSVEDVIAYFEGNKQGGRP